MNPKFLAHYTDGEDKYIYVFFSKVKSVYPTVWNIFMWNNMRPGLLWCMKLYWQSAVNKWF